MRRFFIYILTNHSRTLYVGVTNNLEQRFSRHLSGTGSSFTSKYKLNQLVYYEEFTDIRYAIAREKEIKGWTRAKKIALIEAENPQWLNLAVYDDGTPWDLVNSETIR